jgi:hypothetical protein
MIFLAVKGALKRTFILLAIFLLCTASAQAHTLNVTNDTFNSSVLVNEVQGDKMEVFVRDSGGTRRTFAQFNPATLPTGTTGADINKATLRLFVDEVILPGNIDIHRVTSAWDESSLTLNNSPTFNLNPFAANIAFGNSDEHKFITVDITNEVKNWIDNPTTNFGIVLLAQSGANVKFDTKHRSPDGTRSGIDRTRRTSGYPRYRWR